MIRAAAEKSYDDPLAPDAVVDLAISLSNGHSHGCSSVPPGKGKASQLHFPRSGPDGQPIAISHLGRLRRRRADRARFASPKRYRPALGQLNIDLGRALGRRSRIVGAVRSRYCFARRCGWGDDLCVGGTFFWCCTGAAPMPATRCKSRGRQIVAALVYSSVTQSDANR